MQFKECLSDFFDSYFVGDKAYNVLRTGETRITQPSTLVFADGELHGPMMWDEVKGIFTKPGLKFVANHWTENPSAFLSENKELTNSVRYILVEVPTS